MNEISRFSEKGMPVHPANAAAVIGTFNALFGPAHSGISFDPVCIDVQDLLSLLSDERYLLLRFHFIIHDSHFGLMLRRTNKPAYSDSYDADDEFYLIDQCRLIMRSNELEINTLLSTCEVLNAVWTDLIEIFDRNTLCVAHSSLSLQPIFEYGSQLELEGSKVDYFQYDLGLFRGALPEDDILKFYSNKFKERITLIGSFVTQNNSKIFPIDIGKLYP